MQFPLPPASAPGASKVAAKLDALFAWSAKLPASQAWAISALLLLLGGLGDYLTGTDLWFGPVYVLIVCFPAWTLGWRQAIVVGGGCVSVSLLANGPDLYPLGAVAVVWNMMMRLANVAVILLLVRGARRSYDHERAQARTDSLTGLLNKRAFYEDAARVMKRDDRWRLLAYFDLDGFKQINDRLGHAEGDRLLREFATRARAVIRKDDVLARVGGDEFLLLASAGSEGDANELARKLHQRLNASMAGLPYPVKCSTGALVIRSGDTALAHADVQLADQLMYRAKSMGSALVISRQALAADITPAFETVWGPCDCDQPVAAMLARA